MRVTSLLLSGVLLTGCAMGEGEDDYVKDEDGKADSSAEATILDFEFDGELLAGSTWAGTRSLVQDQLLYTIGHLNGDRAVGRLDRLELSNVKTAAAAGGKTRVTYHAKMPVAWGSKTNLPTSYTFKLPADVSYEGTDAFTRKYSHDCVDWGAHDVTSGSMWYYYRPNRAGCSIADADVVKITASATVSTVNSTGKFPEYHKVWEDGALKVVAVFGKYEDGATTSSDAGIAAYDEFVGKMKETLGPYALVTVPASVPSSPGVGTPDITFTATLAAGKTVEVVALLVDNVRTAGATFDARYEALSTRADVIIYSGHAGLGQNVRALARKGSWVAGQYLIVFMNGCDTYAYVDGSLAETRAAVNPDDPTGTKYMEIVTNAMPAYFASMGGASTALVKALMKHDAPVSYETMFRGIDRSQVVLVTGDQDNVYFPGYPGGGGGGDFAPMHEVTSASQGETLAFVTPTAPAGTYDVVMTEDPAHPGGDADLYVDVGVAPTASTYECRPYENGTNERCTITLAAPAKIYVNVVGYAAGENHFVLDVARQGGGTPPPPPTPWAGIDESGTVAKNVEKRWATPALPAGTYVFATTGTGDADLYVRVGAAPTTTTWDCRPYRSSSNETCQVTVADGAPVHVMVRGYASSSTFHLTGSKQ